MSEIVPPARHYPLDQAARARMASNAISIEAMAPAARLSLRLMDEAGIGRAGQAFGATLPREACRFTAKEGREALWLGPDEWLLVAPGEDGPALQAEIEAALAGVPHSLVDVSERSVAIGVTGARAADLLNAGCPLDLSLEACPAGFASRTVFGKSEIVLARRAPERFEVDVWRSFAPYVWGLLEEARREFIV